MAFIWFVSDQEISFEALQGISAADLALLVFNQKLGVAGRFCAAYREYLATEDPGTENTVIISKSHA